MDKSYIIDIGNSLIKIAYVDLNSKTIIEKKAFATKKIIEKKKEIIKILKKYPDKEVFISSIAPKALNNLKKVINNDNRIIIIKNDNFRDICNPKIDIDEIGIDILASSYKALKVYNKSLVISCGTAIFISLNYNNKLDSVIIMPSIIKSFNNLSSTCELINNVSFNNFSEDFGTNTIESLSAGYFHMIQGTFLSIFEYAYKKYGINDFIICGGNHKYILKLKQLKSYLQFNLDFSMVDIVILGLIEKIKDLNI
ncbi:MAG: type III pantothenate kinase [Mycoplasmoidaceae bacterium]